MDEEGRWICFIRSPLRGMRPKPRHSTRLGGWPFGPPSYTERVRLPEGRYIGAKSVKNSCSFGNRGKERAFIQTLADRHVRWRLRFLIGGVRTVRRAPRFFDPITSAGQCGLQIKSQIRGNSLGLGERSVQAASRPAAMISWPAGVSFTDRFLRGWDQPREGNAKELTGPKKLCLGTCCSTCRAAPA